jgi:hypothetical protein
MPHQDLAAGRVPIPDPTVLTTQQLYREITALDTLFTAKLGALQLSVMQSAITVDDKITHLQSLHAEKFLSIQTQFAERDVRTDQTSRDSKVAVDAALQAAKEAVGEQNKSSSSAIAKSESATSKQIDQMGLLISTGNTALNDKIDDLKERLTRLEGNAGGTHQVWGYVVGIAGAVVAIAALGYLIFHH